MATPVEGRQTEEKENFWHQRKAFEERSSGKVGKVLQKKFHVYLRVPSSKKTPPSSAQYLGQMPFSP